MSRDQRGMYSIRESFRALNAWSSLQVFTWWELPQASPHSLPLRGWCGRGIRPPSLSRYSRPRPRGTSTHEQRTVSLENGRMVQCGPAPGEERQREREKERERERRRQRERETERTLCLHITHRIVSRRATSLHRLVYLKNSYCTDKPVGKDEFFNDMRRDDRLQDHCSFRFLLS